MVCGGWRAGTGVGREFMRVYERLREIEGKIGVGVCWWGWWRLAGVFWGCWRVGGAVGGSILAVEGTVAVFGG